MSHSAIQHSDIAHVLAAATRVHHTNLHIGPRGAFPILLVVVALIVAGVVWARRSRTWKRAPDPADEWSSGHSARSQQDEKEDPPWQ